MSDVVFPFIVIFLGCLLVLMILDSAGLINNSPKKTVSNIVKYAPYVKMIEENDLNAIKQVIEKEVFFKAAVLILKSRQDKYLEVTDWHSSGKEFTWVETDNKYYGGRWYTLNFKDGLSHKVLNQHKNFINSDVIAFKPNAEEMKFWQTLFSVLKEEKDKKRALSDKEMKEKEDIKQKKFEETFFINN